MKKIYKLLFTTGIILAVLGCEEATDLASYNHTENIQYGAVLRTIDDMPKNYLINTSFDDSAFIVTVEEQDIEDGGLLKEMRIVAIFEDYSPENGVTEASGLVQTVPASEFYTDTPYGFPRHDINVPWGDIKAGLEFTGDEFAPGDIVKMVLELELTDGRVFDADDASGVISSGFFSSPFQYNTLLACSPLAGEYQVFGWDGYGDGWNGDNAGIEFCIDGDCTVFTIPNGNYNEGIITVPEGAGEMTVSWGGDDWPNEVLVYIIAPDGSEFAFQGTETLALYSNGLFPENDSPIFSISSVMSPGLLPVAVCAE